MTTPAADRRSVPLDRPNYVQPLLAWALPSASVAGTVVYFVMLTSGARWLNQSSVGRSVSRAMLVAVALLAGMLACVWIYGRVAAAVERRSRGSH